MKLSLLIFLSLLIYTGTAHNRTPAEEISKLLAPVNDEEKEEEEEEASHEEIGVLRPVVHKVYVDKGISEHQPEDSGGGDNETLKLHNSLKSLREYLEMLNQNKAQEEPVSKEQSAADDEFGPHYHTLSTKEPPIEMVPEELQDQVKVGDNPPKDLYFQPIPISDKIGMAERNMRVGTSGGQQSRETVLLAISSATLAVLLLLTVFCAATVYYCSKPYRYFDDYSLTSSQKNYLLGPLSSSYTRTEDSSLLWDERMLNKQSGPETRRPEALAFSGFIDELSTFSDESARTFERDRAESSRAGGRGKAEAERRLAPDQAAPPPSVPPPAEGVPPPAEAAPQAPAPAEEPPPPVVPPGEGAPPEPPPAEEAPPAPPAPPAEGAPPPEAAPPEQPPPV